MDLRSRSGYFKRACSACFLVLKGFDKGVNSPLTYLYRSHCSVVFVMAKVYWTGLDSQK